MDEDLLLKLLNSRCYRGKKEKNMWKGSEQLGGFLCPPVCLRTYLLPYMDRVCWWSETRRKVTGAHALFRSMWVSTGSVG